MAEGGYDPDETGTFDLNDDDDDRTPLTTRHRGDEMEMKHRTSSPFIITKPPKRWPPTSTSRQHAEETSFMGETPSGKIYVEREEQQKEEIERRIKAKYPNADVSKFRSKINDYDKVVLKLPRSNAKEHYLDDDEEKLPLQLRKYLGKSIYTLKTEEIAINTALNEKTKVAVKELEEQKEHAPPEEQSEYDRKISILQEQANERSRQNERLRSELPLRQRIKEIFKKYGFTAIAVATTIATVIGVIVSNLKAGLTKVAKGVGNGLKELGKKTRRNPSGNDWCDC